MKQVIGFIFVALIFSIGPLHCQNAPTLDDFMSPNERAKTGVDTLPKEKQQALASWLSLRIPPKSDEKDQSQDKAAHELYLAENVSQGKVLVLSDGSRWEVDPLDVNITALWLFPIKVVIEESKNPQYPFIMKSERSGSSVRVRKIEG